MPKTICYLFLTKKTSIFLRFLKFAHFQANKDLDQTKKKWSLKAANLTFRREKKKKGEKRIAGRRCILSGHIVIAMSESQKAFFLLCLDYVGIFLVTAKVGHHPYFVKTGYFVFSHGSLLAFFLFDNNWICGLSTVIFFSSFWKWRRRNTQSLFKLSFIRFFAFLF